MFKKTKYCGSQIGACLKLAHDKNEKENPFYHGGCIICRLITSTFPQLNVAMCSHAMRCLISKGLVSGVKTEKGQNKNWKKLATALFKRFVFVHCYTSEQICMGRLQNR